MGSGRLSLVGQIAVLFAMFVGQENPQGIDAQGGSERGMEQGEPSQNDGRNPCPGTALNQPQADADAARGKNCQAASRHIDEELNDKGS